MNGWMLIGMLLIAAGFAAILYTFRMQKKEDNVRVKGYYTTASVSDRTEHKGKVRLTFSFTADFKPVTYTGMFDPMEAKNCYKGRKTLIVYDQKQDRLYINPMRESRIRQAKMLTLGGLIILTGVTWTVMFYGMP